MTVITSPNLDAPDDFYQALIDAHQSLSDSQSQALNARLILLLANHIGRLDVLQDALTLAREASNFSLTHPGDPAMNVPPTIQRWHEIVEHKRAEAIADLLADDVVFQSPAVHTPQRGKALTVKYLSAALKVLNGAAFKYNGEWFAERSAVLEFETEVDGLTVNGVDIIHWNEAGKITQFRVMIRPLKALNAVIPHMARLLQPG